MSRWTYPVLCSIRRRDTIWTPNRSVVSREKWPPRQPCVHMIPPREIDRQKKDHGVRQTSVMDTLKSFCGEQNAAAAAHPQLHCCSLNTRSNPAICSNTHTASKHKTPLQQQQPYNFPARIITRAVAAKKTAMNGKRVPTAPKPPAKNPNRNTM